MKLLFDENLSARLVDILSRQFPSSEHVESALGRGRTDAEIWEYARRKGFVIATKDGDYRQRAFVAAPPPKVLWLALGNAGTDQIARLLLSKHEEIERFAANGEQALLILSG